MVSNFSHRNFSWIVYAQDVDLVLNEMQEMLDMFEWDIISDTELELIEKELDEIESEKKVKIKEKIIVEKIEEEKFFNKTITILDTWIIAELDSIIDENILSNFNLNENRYSFLNKKSLVGTDDIDLSFDDWKILHKIVMKSKGEFTDNHIFVVLPEGATAYDDKWKKYKKKILSPKIEDKEIFVNWDNYQLVFSVWGNKRIHFEYDDGSPANADFFVSLDNTFINVDFPVYSSQDGSTWDYLDSAGMESFMWNEYLRFQSDHFTYFAIGTEEWSFLINNWDLNTASTWVVLNNNIQNIAQMKFGNNTGELLSASWEAFSVTRNWFLTTGDGTKFVYAMFEDNSGNTGMVFDSIILDEEENVSWVNYSVLPTRDRLALRFDADDLSMIETWAWYSISGWLDKAWNNYDAVQSTVWSRPTLANWVIRTKAAVSFDGADDYLALKDINYEWTETLSGLFACVVFRTDFVGSSYNDNWAFLDFDRSDFFDFYIRWDDWKLGFSTRWSSVSDNYGTTSYNDDDPHIACVSYDNSIVNDTQIIVDGNTEFDQNTFSLWQYLGKSTTRYGFLGDGSEASSFDAGRNNFYYDGYMAEIVYYEWALNTWDQKELQCYLSDKWGIDLNFSCDNYLEWISVIYDPLSASSGNILATLTGYNSSIEILNNWWSGEYLFENNWSFIFLYEDVAGNMGSSVATVDWIDKIKPTASVEYDPNSTTTWEVLAMLTGFSETEIVITNNAWSGHYIFDDNGNFVFEFKDAVGNTGNAVASVTWIENTGWVAYVIYDPEWPIIVSGEVNATLTGQNEVFVVTNNGGSENYIFTENGELIFEYSYSGWTLTWNKTAYVDWIDNTCDIWSFEYSPDTDTYGDVIVTITWFSETGVVVTNNSGSVDYIFTGNGSFVFELMDSLWNTGESTAIVDWIQSTVPDDLIVARKIADVGPMEWESISFEKSYNEIPFVFVTPVTENTTDTYPIPLVRNITTWWFQITSCVEQGNSICSTTANDEDFHYFVVDPGDVVWLSWIDVDMVSTDTDGSDTTVSFNKTFVNAPYVRITPQTYNQWWNNWMVAWIDDGTLSTNSMDMVGCRHNGNGDWCTAGTAESVAYLAIDVVNANITGFQYGTKSISNSTWTSTSFGQNYGEARIMVTQNSDNGAQDPEYSWAKNITTNSADIRFCEQDDVWDCDSHSAEDMMRFTLEGDVPPTAKIVYSKTWITNQDVIVMLTWESESITIINNGGSRYYNFTENWTFVYQFKDATNNTNTVTAEVTWINKDLPYGELIYSENGFVEDRINNDGTIETWIVINLSGDTFASNISGYIEFSNVPTGLTWIIKSISGTQINIFLTGVSVDHGNIEDVYNLWVMFLTWAFNINASITVNNWNKNDLEINFWDPFATGWFYSVADTLLDADTEPNNGCDEGICQEANYGALNYMWASNFGSVSLIKFDLTSIDTGSVVVSATLDLTRMDIGWLQGTWFDLTKIINNTGWIEGVWSAAWAGAEEALVGEPNYKQRKRTQENWNNGDPGFVSDSDYIENNLLENSHFDTVGDENKTFTFNSVGLAVLQEWLDDVDTNQWFAFGHADKEWTIIYSKEETVVGRRPQLFINYALDIEYPQILSLNPSNNQTWVVLDSNLVVEFNEKISAISWYNIVIKRSSDDSIFETIDVGSSQLVFFDNDTAIITFSTNLENNTWYYVQIDSGAFVDRASNPFTGILNTTTWSFVTLDANSVPWLTWTFSSWVMQTTWTLWWEIISTGSSIITERWVYWDVNDWFNPLDWTKVSEVWSWNSLWSFSIPVTWLPAGLWVYYRAFATNDAWVWYSSQNLFLTKPANPVTTPATNVSNRSAVANRTSVTWADSYQLYVSSDSGFASYVDWYWPKSSLVWDSYSIEWIESETTYYYKLLAQNTAWLSFDSNIVSFTTSYLPYPVMELKLEETNGSIAYDEASNHDGILDGWISFAQTWVDWNWFCLDGVDAKITTIDFSYGPDFAIQFWFKDSANVGTEYLFSHGSITDANSVNVFLDAWDDSLKTEVNGQTLFVISGQDYTDLLDDERHMYTLVVDDNFAAWWQKKIAVYLDGQQRWVDTSLLAWVYNPNPNITMWRRSIATANTYFEWCLDDIRIYNQDLFPYEVEELFDVFVTDLQAPYVLSTIPISGAVDISLDQDIRIEFSKNMDHASVESTWVFLLSPALSWIVYNWDDNTLIVSHDDFAYLTSYVVTINTWAEDISGVAMEASYVFDFTTQNNIYLTYEPTLFEESTQNDWSIKAAVNINLNGDTFSSFVVSSWYINIQNLPTGLTGVFVRNSDSQISFILSWSAVNHNDSDDVDNLTVVFVDDAFSFYTATEVSSSTKSDLYIDFNDPNSMSLYPIRDTTLDVLNSDYNYGASTVHFIWDWSFVLIEFDLTVLPLGATIDSATLTFSKLDGAWPSFSVGKLINNSGWVEGTKLGSTASVGESTYDEFLDSQNNWFGNSAWLLSWTDYDARLLIDSISFSWNETRIFTLNSDWISILSGRFADADSNEWFVLYGGSDRFEIGSKDNWLESYRPKLLVSYTLSSDETAPTLTWLITIPVSPIYNSGYDQNITIDFDSDEYPIYLTYNLYSETWVLVDTAGEYTILNSWSLIADYSISSWLVDGIYELDYSVRDEVNNINTWFISEIVIDTMDPTAYVEYLPSTWDYISGSVLVTLTWFSETWIVITNNSWSPNYTFTGNGIFTFEFIDLAWNIWSFEVVVDWIYFGPMSIWSLTWFAFINALSIVNYEQILEEEVPDYFWVNDPNWYNSGFHTTVSISDFTWSNWTISALNVFMFASGVDLLSGMMNPRVTISSGLNSYLAIDGPVTYLQREDGYNSGVTWKYGNKPWLKIVVPPYQAPWSYKAVITYTLYEE